MSVGSRHSLVTSHALGASSAADKGEQQGQFAPGLQCKGAPNSAGLVKYVSHIPV